MATFETGLSTFAANDVALTVSNDGDAYRRFQGYRVSAPHIAKVVVSDACRKYGRAEYGRSFSTEELDECVAYVIRSWDASN